MNYSERLKIREIIKQALKEDIGARDITTESIIPAKKFIKAVILSKENGVICGLDVVSFVFKLQDKNIKFKPLVQDGDFIKKGKILATITGKARSILTAERVALNFLSLLSGISTNTRKFVNAIKPYKAKIMDTRKTMPTLRFMEKYAVRIGGGFNHRMSLDEMVLIKDSHIKIVGGINKLTAFSQKYKNVEVEVRNPREFKEALCLMPDIIMLDNMKIGDIKKAVKIRNNLSLKIYNPRPKLEVSGGVNLKNVKGIASTGIDMISIGALTHSIKSLDIKLEILKS